MTEKKKNTSHRPGTIPFTILWTLAYGLGYAMLIVFGIFVSSVNRELLYQFPLIVYTMIMAGIPAFIYSIAQQLLMRWKFGINIQNWVLWSTLAAIATGASVQILEWLGFFNINFPNSMIAITVILGYVFALPAIGQAWALRHHVKRAWLWPLAALVSAATFALPIATAPYFDSEIFSILLAATAGILQGAVMALTLIWLFGMTRIEPLKRNLEDDNLDVAENNLSTFDEDKQKSAMLESKQMKMRQ